MATADNQTVVGVFADRRHAEVAMDALRHAPFPEGDIGFVSPTSTGTAGDTPTARIEHKAEDGAVTGAVTGGARYNGARTSPPREHGGADADRGSLRPGHHRRPGRRRAAADLRRLARRAGRGRPCRADPGAVHARPDGRGRRAPAGAGRPRA